MILHGMILHGIILHGFCTFFRTEPRLAQVLAPEQPRLHVRGVEAPPLLDGRQGLPRLAPVEHARRLSLQHPFADSEYLVLQDFSHGMT